MVRGLRQHVINEAIDQWRGRLRACVTADGCGAAVETGDFMFDAVLYAVKIVASFYKV